MKEKPAATSKAKRKVFKVSDIVPADYNPRTIKDKAKKGLQTSLGKYGYLQDVIVNIRDGKNIIVGGHKRLEAMGLDPAGKIECTVVDLDQKDEKALNVALNSRHISGEFDEKLLEDLLSEIEGHELFEDLNFDDLVTEFDLFSADKIKKYTQKINLPIYEPSGPCPGLSDLYDPAKTMELVKNIDKSESPEAVKIFLKIAATRHTVFDYGQIAEYYSHADKEIQELMEDSALVIIDFKQAIENGLVEISEKIDILRGVDRDE